MGTDRPIGRNKKRPNDPETKRLSSPDGWRKWGPYLSERSWSTVREDYSPEGRAWDYFDFQQSSGRAYRWSEDGLGGLSDENQILCFSLGLWNGVDPVLKERAFGVTGPQGSHGEDVKEYYFYKSATPTHSYLHYLYKYPQSPYPYQALIEGEAGRLREDPTFSLLETGVFQDNRYWDIELFYAKASEETVYGRIRAVNRSSESATIHLVPTLWFRNTWSWGTGPQSDLPSICPAPLPKGTAVSLATSHPDLGMVYFYGQSEVTSLFSNNESDFEGLWGQPNPMPYAKNAFHHRIVNGDPSAVSPEPAGTKWGGWRMESVEGGGYVEWNFVLSNSPLKDPFEKVDALFHERKEECDRFYRERLPEADPESRDLATQAFAGMVWNKQFYHFDVTRWLEGDKVPPPPERRKGRNQGWKHLKANEILSMPDTWEYPWFAAWDLPFHAVTFSLIDLDFAKTQIELLLKETYLHPNGQIPAYEWMFDDVNPPLHAWGALTVFREDRRQTGKADWMFLEHVFHKLLMNLTWWFNKKDQQGRLLFEGGFLGLDNISIFDRSIPLPSGYVLKQADSTGWMAFYAVEMTVIALELTTLDPAFEELAISCYLIFLRIAKVIAGIEDQTVSLWDKNDGFFKDVVWTPEGNSHFLDVFSWVGIIPFLACEVVGPRLLEKAPKFRSLLRKHTGGIFDGHKICACPEFVNEQGEHLLSLVDAPMIAPIFRRLFDPEEFLSPFGVRSLSRCHAHHPEIGWVPGIGDARIDYSPGESRTALFGGNSNWRGPVWLPLNYLLIQTLEKFHRYLGPAYHVARPDHPDGHSTLLEAADDLSGRLLGLYRRGSSGLLPAHPPDSPFQHDPAWRDLRLFFEYFHPETGQGFGASHQTGWTGLLANLVFHRHNRDVPYFDP
ncbi:MAG: MGH1-like glycoside hydrolase domain-containing protein [Leptospirales bacterium]